MQLRQDLGLDDPIAVQFGRFVWQRGAVRLRHFLPGQAAGHPAHRRTLSGDPGAGAWRPPCSRSLLGIPMGVYTGIHRDSWLSKVFLTVSLIGISLPTFLIGILLIYMFAVRLGVLPSFGRGDTVRHRLLAHRAAHRLGPQGADPAGHHAGAVPDDAGDAPGAIRDAGGAAHRLHQVCPRARAARPRHQLRPCAEEHAGSGDHRHRPAARRHHRLRHHHRDGVPVARHGADVHPGRAERRHPGDGGLPAAGGLPVRADQFHRRSDLRARRPAHPHPSGVGCEPHEASGDGTTPTPNPCPHRRRGAGRAFRGRGSRAARQRPVLQLPALQAGGRGRGPDGAAGRRRAARAADRAARPLRSEIAGAASTPTCRRPGRNGGDRRFLLGTDDQGRDILSTILYGTRSLAADRHRLGAAGGRASALSLGLWAGYAGGRVDSADHAHRRRAAHLSGHPHRPADRRRGAGDLQELSDRGRQVLDPGDLHRPVPTGCSMRARCAA